VSTMTCIPVDIWQVMPTLLLAMDQRQPQRLLWSLLRDCTSSLSRAFIFIHSISHTATFLAKKKIDSMTYGVTLIFSVMMITGFCRCFPRFLCVISMFSILLFFTSTTDHQFICSNIKNFQQQCHHTFPGSLTFDTSLQMWPVKYNTQETCHTRQIQDLPISPTEELHEHCTESMETSQWTSQFY
jgi:hypothetical protein